MVDDSPGEIPEALRKIADGRHHDPFAVLGPRIASPGQVAIRAFLPGAIRSFLEIGGTRVPMRRVFGLDLFEWNGPAAVPSSRYRLAWEDSGGHVHVHHDPYCFAPQLSDLDLHLFGKGRNYRAYDFLGARPYSIDGISGVLFATWAPHAERVSVVGDFNRWDGRAHPMRCRGSSGVWELFIPEILPGMLYKFEIRNRETGVVQLKSDPYGRRFERRPATASVVEASTYVWRDERWMHRRANTDRLGQPVCVYEVHLGSWRRGDDGRFLGYQEAAHALVQHVRSLGFTHIELMPVTEHPYDGSWGYQTCGYFAPTSRFGAPDDFRYLVDHCHQNGIGVILDWAPAHFARDAHGLARFDGAALYEHHDPRRGEHRQWDSLIFDYGRNEVRAFLISSALYWLREFHIDGLRVDAVASMLYLDYAREPGDWVPNAHGGNEDLEAVRFLRELNEAVHHALPGVLTIAEESSSWPGVSRPVAEGGLGFTLKWNMGWMNDTLRYMRTEAVHRRHHHDLLTFGLLYAFSENFLLPLSHDEVVHLKRSLLEKMPGDEWQRFANLRLLYSYLFTYPGKKLLFMGGEFGQRREWDHDRELDWPLCEEPRHAGLQRLVADLNRLYRDHPALHRFDVEPRGFEWLDCHDAAHSLLTYARYAEEQTLLVALNFTATPRAGYRLGVRGAGNYEIVFNSDSRFYGGGDVGNHGILPTEPIGAMGRAHSLCLTLPPLAGVVLRKC